MQVSGFTDCPNPMVIKEEKEEEKDMAVNLHVGFNERQQKRLSKTLQHITNHYSSKRGKLGFERGISSKSIDIVPTIGSYSTTPIVKQSNVHVLFHSMGDSMLISGDYPSNQQSCLTITTNFPR